jgi:hypothetical protein
MVSLPAPAAKQDHGCRDQALSDSVLEQLRIRKIARVGLNVHVYAAVSDALLAFVAHYELPKGDTASIAMQEFLEERLGRSIPGIPRITPLPTTTGEVHDESGPATR